MLRLGQPDDGALECQRAPIGPTPGEEPEAPRHRAELSSAPFHRPELPQVPKCPLCGGEGPLLLLKVRLNEKPKAGSREHLRCKSQARNQTLEPSTPKIEHGTSKSKSDRPPPQTHTPETFRCRTSTHPTCRSVQRPARAGLPTCLGRRIMLVVSIHSVLKQLHPSLQDG